MAIVSKKPPAPHVDPPDILQRLAAPFSPDEVQCKPGAFNQEKTRALATWYIDARAVQDRLDAVVGIGNWCDRYTDLGGAVVECRLSIWFADAQRWVTKVDCGGANGEEDGTLAMKGAYSDSFKRAAVKFSIFRYGYAIPNTWYGWDNNKREWTQQPKLPGFALPTGESARRDPEPDAPGVVGISAATLKALEQVCGSLRKSPTAVRISLEARYQVQTFQQLTEKQGAELLRELERIARAVDSNGTNGQPVRGRKGGAG